jgi:hypothetical protein
LVATTKPSTAVRRQSGLLILFNTKLININL